MVGIATDSTPLEEPKDPDTCNMFALYQMVATEEEVAALRVKYLGGNFGYGHAKQALYEAVLKRFEKERTLFNYYMEHPEQIEKALRIGAEKATKVANKTLARVRPEMGF